MKRIFLLLFLLVLVARSNAQVNVLPVNKNNIMLAFEAIGFYEGVMFTLDTIECLLPDKKLKCRLERSHFRSSYREATKNIYKYVYSAIGENDVKEMIAEFVQDYKRLIVGSSINVDVVEPYLDEIESPTKETFLYFKYINSPAKEILDGHYEFFNTREHPKSSGLELKMKIPTTYKCEEGDSPNVVQKFNEFEGHFGSKSFLTITEIPESSGAFDALASPSLINESDILEMCLDEGAKFRHFEVIKIDGIPFGVVEMSRMQDFPMGNFEVIYLAYITYFRNRLIVLSFSTLVDSDREAHYENNKLLFKTIAMSMVFTDRWK